MRELVLDNSILSRFKDGTIDLALVEESSSEVQYYVPSTQHIEFLDDFDNLREDLQDSIQTVLNTLEPELLNLESAPFGSSPFGHGPFGGGDSKHYEEILNRMPEDDTNSNWDALGAETAINCGLTFVTQDSDLQDALKDYSPDNLMTFEQYRELLETYE
ncbi:hypothetical protein [Haloferax sp. ATB1]|uniref:hypothetical protein n=1 Tax=Haloferax sp. ATB1 TaxID=1508454 RepID=UPI0005B1DAFD|nr:hypothetical protein [Haloferax sp. ATB1]